MGCGSSKIAVAPAPLQTEQLPRTSSEGQSQVGGWQEEMMKKQISATSIGSRKSVKIRPNKILPKPLDESASALNIIRVQEAAIQGSSSHSESDSSQYSSRESIHSNTRLISAHSTESKASRDSGLGEEYAHVITEGSETNDKEVANLPQGTETPDLTIEGEKITTPSSVGHRRRPARLPPIQPVKSYVYSEHNSPPPLSLATKRVTFSNNLIDELPDSPSIIKKPCSKGGLAFDIVLNDSPMDPAMMKKRPAHLQKLNHRRAIVSHEELDEKQRAAEQRRKV